MSILTLKSTGEFIDTDVVAQTIELYLTAGMPRRRRQYVRQLIDFGVVLDGIRSELADLLERGARALGGFGAQSSPADEAKEQKWLGWLERYETVCDLLSAIQDGVLAEKWDRVSARREVA